MGCEENCHLNQQECAIAVMAKRPEPGKVKTRLCPPLSPRQAADLYEAFFLDTVSLVSGFEHTDLLIAYDPDTAWDYFSRIVSSAVKCIPQGRGNLGDRLARISHRLFDLGYRKLIILASDTPLLPRDVIRSAIARLDEIDVVLGPCDDGGYYLIGLRSCAPWLFAGIPWSTSQVLDHTIQRAQEAKMTWELLPPGYDIDTWEDAERLSKDLKGNAAGDSDRCLRTKKALRYLVPEDAAQTIVSCPTHPFRDR